MNCPSCNQKAIPFYRFPLLYRLLFPSSTGVSFNESMKGKFKCQHCGTILQITRSTMVVWIWMALMLAFIVLYVSIFNFINNSIGTSWAIGVFIILLLVISVIVGYVSWKMSRVEKIV